MITIVRPNPVRPNPQRPRGNGFVLPLPRFYCGLDLGHQRDPSALAVVERVIPTVPGDQGAALIPLDPLPDYHVRALERALGVPYPTIAKSMARMFRQPPFAADGVLVVDATGVGLPVVQNMREEGLRPVAVTITGGSTVTGGRRAYRVPKVDLVAGLTVLFQQRRIKIASSLAHAETLMRELEAMRQRITASGHDTYGGEGEHDDLVLALALALWLAERRERRHRMRLEGRMSADQVIGEGLMNHS